MNLNFLVWRKEKKKKKQKKKSPAPQRLLLIWRYMKSLKFLRCFSCMLCLYWKIFLKIAIPVVGNGILFDFFFFYICNVFWCIRIISLTLLIPLSSVFIITMTKCYKPFIKPGGEKTDHVNEHSRKGTHNNNNNKEKNICKLTHERQ